MSPAERCSLYYVFYNPYKAKLLGEHAQPSNHWHAFSWWRHQMETFSALLALCEGNTGGFPSQRPVTRSFDVFFDLPLNKRSSKQSGCPWFETPSRPLWRRCNVCYRHRPMVSVSFRNASPWHRPGDSTATVKIVAKSIFWCLNTQTNGLV